MHRPRLVSEASLQSVLMNSNRKASKSGSQIPQPLLICPNLNMPPWKFNAPRVWARFLSWPQSATSPRRPCCSAPQTFAAANKDPCSPKPPEASGSHRKPPWKSLEAPWKSLEAPRELLEAPESPTTSETLRRHSPRDAEAPTPPSRKTPKPPKPYGQSPY